jgi:hypothetical protein
VESGRKRRRSVKRRERGIRKCLNKGMKRIMKEVDYFGWFS